MVGEKITTSDGRKYVIEQEIDRGAFGVVYLGKDASGSVFAIKVIGPVDEPELAESFERETVAAAGVSHKNVLAIQGHGKHASKGREYLFTVMEFCADGNYRSVLKSRLGAKAPLDATLLEFGQILQGLRALHEKTVHRDLKPENILRVGDVLKLADLGFSRFVDEATRTLTFKGSGTPRYMAPETWERKRATPATDMYSVGVMLFEALTGKPPFQADDFAELRNLHLFQAPPRPKTLNTDIPSHIDGAVRKLLEKDPRNRYQTAAELIAVLQTSAVPAADDDLTSIAGKIRRNYDAEEQKKLEAERTAKEAQDLRARDEYMQRQLWDLADEVADGINSQLQETNIRRYRSDSEAVYEIGNRSLHIGFFRPGDMYFGQKSEDLKKSLRERHVVHGGYIAITEGREQREGWNVVLTRSPDDMYGEWLLVETEMSALAGKAFRYSPSSTPALLFAENLAYHWRRAMHIYVLKDKLLTKEDMVRIFDRLIP